MRNDRDRVLGDIRRGLGRSEPEPEVVRRFEAALRRPERNPIPQCARGDEDTLLKRFIAMAEQASATVIDAIAREKVPAAVLDFAQKNQLDREVLIAPDPELEGLDWSAFQTRHGLPRRWEPLAVTGALAAAAETGTIVVCSGPRHPSSLNLLPDNHVVVLPRSRIRGSYEETWDLVREAHPEGLPRTVLWITGPSRTGDIEQTLYLGAHGPHRLHIVITLD